MLYKLLVPPRGDPGQHFTINCDLLAEINNANIFGFCVLRTGHPLMTSLNTCQVYSPAEDLQSSQDRCHLAYRERKGERALTCRVGTWNVW